jgi:hypothetical protein
MNSVLGERMSWNLKGTAMSNHVLWRRLTETDFNAMHGKASPYGHGGGAMHVALGVRNDEFKIDSFLNAPGQTDVTVKTEAQLGKHDLASLDFPEPMMRVTHRTY